MKAELMPKPVGPENVAFVGQGPNRASWERGLGVAARLHPDWKAADLALWSATYCARIAITGAIGTKIGAMLDLEVGEFFRSRFARRNLNARWNGKSGKGDVFDAEAARGAAAILSKNPRLTHFVLLGAEVAKAFGLAGAPLELRFDKTTGKNFLLFPHPSGINLWWNEEFNRFRARKRLREFVGLTNP